LCGVFGFIGSGRPDLSRLREIAEITESRGRHAFGLAWIDRSGELHSFKRPGAASACLADIDLCRGALAVIGHCRFATHGEPTVNRNNHPHRAGRGYIVHNGVVHNYIELLIQYGLRARTDCDSEVLGLLMARCGGSLLDRAVWAVDQTEGPLAMLGIWPNPPRLVVARRGNPLYLGEGPEGYYFASLPIGLPGTLYVATPDLVSLWRLARNGRIVVSTRDLAPWEPKPTPKWLLARSLLDV